MAIRSESELLWSQFKKLFIFIVTLPFHLIELLFRPSKLPHKLSRVREWFKEFFVWFFETKVTAWLIIANTICFIASFLIPKDILPSLILYPASVLAGNVFSIFTSAFLHADIFHLMGNMLVLLIMGRVVEKHLGSKGMFFVYFGSLIISSMSAVLVYHYVFGDNVGAVGASGAISGVTSAAILLAPFYLTYLLFAIPIPIALVGWLFIMQDTLAILNPTPGDNVGHIAHMGGYIAITILVFILSKEGKKKLMTGLVINGILVTLTFAVYNIWIIGLL